MKGFPKEINTTEDLFNCLSLVQSGEFKAEDLKKQIQALENRRYINAPVISLGSDRKTAIITYCSEAAEGQTILTTVNCQIVFVTHIADEADTEQKPKQTKLTLSKAIPAETKYIGIPSPIDPLLGIGVTEEQLNSIKVVLNQYE